MDKRPQTKRSPKPPTHGGSRPGAGRPPFNVTRVNVTLDNATAENLRELGEGNLSAGIRLAALMATYGR
jgi:hypothetical protein